MALDLVSVPFPSEAGPPLKKRRLGWDVPDPALLAHAARLQVQLASQLLQGILVASTHEQRLITSSENQGDRLVDGTLKGGTPEFRNRHDNGTKPVLQSYTSPLLQHEDNSDGHLDCNVGENLTSRYKILRKMGEGTFGRVLECLDQDSEELVAIKIVRSAERYREAAMIEIEVLHTLHQNDRQGFRGKAFKYFRHERSLDWPAKYTTRESVRAVERLPKLRDLLARHVERVPNSFINLLERMFSYDPLNRLSAREALQHPFFKEKLWR